MALIAPAGLLRTLPKEYADLKIAAGQGVEGEALRALVAGALGLEDDVVEEIAVETEAQTGAAALTDFSQLCRWQFEHHQGHARSFASALLHGPVQGQEEIWTAACGVLKGKRAAAKDGAIGGAERLVVICAADDTVVRAGDVREDLEGFMGAGEEGKFSFETLPGGHGFLADEGVCKDVVQILGREWGI